MITIAYKKGRNQIGTTVLFRTNEAYLASRIRNFLESEALDPEAILTLKAAHLTLNLTYRQLLRALEGKSDHNLI